MSKITTEEFVLKAKEKFGNKFDYSKVKYITGETKICIICHEKDEFGEEHGEFWITPHNFMKRGSCPKCSKKAKIDLPTFIKRAKAVHGSKYDYSKVDIVNVKTKITIICPEHGEFQQSINKHIQCKQGCPICGLKLAGEKRRSSTEEFIEKAKHIHKNLYNYCKVRYTKNHEKVCIICPKHGLFWLTPMDHLMGKGCPICNNSKGERFIHDYLNSINIPFVQEKVIYYENLNMRLDFYLELNNQRYIIEYHGKQHYIPIEYFGGKLQFEKLQYRDRKLREYCKDSNIKLLEIKYDTRFEQIPELINNFIKNA